MIAYMQDKDHSFFNHKIFFACLVTKNHPQNCYQIFVSSSSQLMLDRKNSGTFIGFLGDNFFKIDMSTTLS